MRSLSWMWWMDETERARMCAGFPCSGFRFCSRVTTGSNLPPTEQGRQEEMASRPTSCACAPSRYDQPEGLEAVPIEAPVPRQQTVGLDEGVAAHQEVCDDAILPPEAFSESVPALRGAECRGPAHDDDFTLGWLPEE
jgi:hypothetical protein